jgi:hypothetical protein
MLVTILNENTTKFLNKRRHNCNLHSSLVRVLLIKSAPQESLYETTTPLLLVIVPVILPLSLSTKSCHPDSVMINDRRTGQRTDRESHCQG